MGEKLGTISDMLKGATALKGGMTPKVGTTWKFSSFSKTRERSDRLAPMPRSIYLLESHAWPTKALRQDWTYCIG